MTKYVCCGAGAPLEAHLAQSHGPVLTHGGMQLMQAGRIHPLDSNGKRAVSSN